MIDFEIILGLFGIQTSDRFSPDIFYNLGKWIVYGGGQASAVENNFKNLFSHFWL